MTYEEILSNLPLALAAIEAGHYDRALKELAKGAADCRARAKHMQLLADDEQRVEAVLHEVMGDIYTSKSDYVRAAECFNKAATLMLVGSGTVEDTFKAITAFSAKEAAAIRSIILNNTYDAGNSGSTVSCADGTVLIVHADLLSYCAPKDTLGKWTHYNTVEIGAIVNADGSRCTPPERWKPFADTSTVSGFPYGWVPVEYVLEFIAEHGGEVQRE